MRREKLLKSLLLGIPGALLILLSATFFKEPPLLSRALVMTGVITMFSPPLLVWYWEHRYVKALENNFIAFLRDFAEAIKGGMNIPLALRHVSRNDYGNLTPYVKKMAAQIEWGIPLHDILLKFSRKVDSPMIKRCVSSIVESHLYGGNIASVMEALGHTTLEIEKLRSERKAFMQGQVTTGYMIFFVFLGIIVGMEKFLLPSFVSNIGGGGILGGVGLGGEAIAPVNAEEIVKQLRPVFAHLVMMQAIFSGLAIGKMSEGRLAGGVRHVFILLTISLIFILVAG